MYRLISVNTKKKLFKLIIYQCIMDKIEEHLRYCLLNKYKNSPNATEITTNLCKVFGKVVNNFRKC